MMLPATTAWNAAMSCDFLMTAIIPCLALGAGLSPLEILALHLSILLLAIPGSQSIGSARVLPCVLPSVCY